MRPRRRRNTIHPKDVAHKYINITDRDGFYVKKIAPKGRGVFAKTCFEKGDFLLQYHGKVLTWEEGNILEEELSSGFRFFLQWKGKKYCVDATEEPTSGPMLGRLVNHGERQEVNVKLVVIDVGSQPVLCLFALRNIREDEELLYNYGTNNLPWKENLPAKQTGNRPQKKKLPLGQDEDGKHGNEGTNDTQVASSCKEGIPSEQCTISAVDEGKESNADNKEAASITDSGTQVGVTIAVANDEVSSVGTNCAGTDDTHMASTCKVRIPSEQCTISVVDKGLESSADNKEAASITDSGTQVVVTKAVANDEVSSVGTNCAGTDDTHMASTCKVGIPSDEQCTISVVDKGLESNADNKEAASITDSGTQVGVTIAVANDEVSSVGANCAGTNDTHMTSVGKAGMSSEQCTISVVDKGLKSNADEAASISDSGTQVAVTKAVANDKVSCAVTNCAGAINKLMGSECKLGIRSERCTVSVVDNGLEFNADREAVNIAHSQTQVAVTKALPDVQVANADKDIAHKLGILNDQPAMSGVDMVSKFGAVQREAEVAVTPADDDETSEADTEILEPRCYQSDTESVDNEHLVLSETPESVCNTLGGGFNESFTESVTEDHYTEERGNSYSDTANSSHTGESDNESDSGDESYIPETDDDADSMKSYVIPLMTRSRSSLHPSHKRDTRFCKNETGLSNNSPSTSKACQQFDVSTTCGDKSDPDSDRDEVITIGKTRSHRRSSKDENECTSTSLTDTSKVRCNSEEGEASSSTSSVDKETESRVYVMTTNNKGNSRTYDKPAYCYVCSKPQKKLSVHIHQHSEETLVAQWLAEEKGDKKDALWTKIRNFGNHLHNYGVLQKGEGDLIVVYRPDREADPSDYNPCVDCLGYYSSSEFYRHKCKLRKETHGDQAKRKAGIKQSRLLLPPPKGLKEGDIVHKLVASFHVDEVSMCIKGDPLILQLAEKFCFKHGHDSEQFNTLRTRLREVARLLLEYRLVSGNKNDTLADIILPSSFETLLKAVRSVSGFDEKTHLYSKPSLALKLGQTMKKVAMLVISKALIDGDTTKERQARDILTLISENWEVEVSSHALRTLYQNKRNNPKLLPLTEDVALLTKYLKERAAINRTGLTKAQSTEEIQKFWKELAKVTLTQMILFNRKRQGEISKLTLNDFASLKKGESHVLDVQALSQFEQNLVNTMWRVEVVGKRGRTVPVLITNEVKGAVDEIVKMREAAGIASTNHFVFALPDGSANHIRGCDTLRSFSVLCGAKLPDLIRSTRLRKHIAVMSQVMALKDNELDVLANFLGHDIQVHREYYRLPDPALQVAKVSKLLIALEGTGGDPAELLQGKSLEDLEVNEDEEIDDSHGQYDEDDGDDEDDSFSCSEDLEEQSEVLDLSKSDENLQKKTATEKDSQRGRKRKLDDEDQERKLQKVVPFREMGNVDLTTTKRNMQRVPWSKEEKDAVNRRLWRFIAGAKVPGKKDCEQCKLQEPCLRKRHWKNIKDFVRNRICTDARRGQRGVS